MCGIVGAVAQRDVALILVEGLKRLEYRGYDSAGIAVIDSQQNMRRHRTLGKVFELQNLLQTQPLSGGTGIAHTRWATHGKPSESNAHPHISGDEIALVHNGIIENYETLRMDLIEKGYVFHSETDSEIVAHLLHEHLKNCEHDFLRAVRGATAKLEGAFAIGFLHSHEPGRLIAVRRGSPLVVGIGIGEHFIASDHLALLPVAQQFIYLEEGDIADVRREFFTIYDNNHIEVKRSIHISSLNQDVAEKGKYRHFMQKEIFEQPRAVAATIEGRIGREHVLEETFGIKTRELFKQIQRIQIIACGTSYHAGLVAQYWLEEIGIPCRVEIASEMRYREGVVEPNNLFITLSQSGETADTLGALRKAKTSGFAGSMAICNVPESSLVRESELVLMTAAGPEIGVASTKAFTTQLTALLLLAASFARHREKNEIEHAIIRELKNLSQQCEQILKLDNEIKNLAKLFANKQHTLFIARGALYPIALEGALKLKEISYIHAEAYPAGELKHGPLALVDKEMPVIALAPNDDLIDKLKSNLQEVRARGGELMVFTDEGSGIKSEPGIRVITMPKVEKWLTPIAYTIPLQLLAYHVAVLKGTDVDQPRNLAKSVTVE
jgi:glucosamine--fructose-6-phosphate aminotransferase (isomerizing)